MSLFRRNPFGSSSPCALERLEMETPPTPSGSRKPMASSSRTCRGRYRPLWEPQSFGGYQLADDADRAGHRGSVGA
jgi:hypothetical protein